MSLVKTGGGITDISGSMAGNVFARDSSGLHVRSNPKRVKQCTPAQLIQRKAFAKARKYSTDHRTVSYLIYRALNNLPFIFDAIVTGETDPDCTGKYVLAGQFNGVDWYEHVQKTFAIDYIAGIQMWVISAFPYLEGPPLFRHPHTIEGIYDPVPFATGHPLVQLRITPPPADYEPT